jgi:hypothetical protein
VPFVAREAGEDIFIDRSQEMTMGSDTDIRRFVEDGFQWGPDVDASDIAVRLPNVDLRPNPVACGDGIQVIVKEGWVTVEATGEVVLNGWFRDRT